MSLVRDPVTLRWQTQTMTLAPALAGSYMPDLASVGCLPNIVRKKHDGDLILHDGEHFQDLDVTGWVVPSGTCSMANVFAQSGVKASSAKSVATKADPGIFTIRDSEITAFQGGIDGNTAGLERMGIDAERVYIHDVVDGFDAFNPKADSDLLCRLAASIVDRLTIGPSKYTSDKVDHNDGIQIQGSGGMQIIGNVLKCMASPQSNTPLGVKYGYPRANGSCVALTANTFRISRPVEVSLNWLGGGRRTIGAVANTKGIAPGVLRVHNNVVFAPETGLGTTSGDWIVVEDPAWLDAGDNYFCDAAGVSTGEPVPIKIGTP